MAFLCLSLHEERSQDTLDAAWRMLLGFPSSQAWLLEDSACCRVAWLLFNTTVYTAEEVKGTLCLLFNLSRLFLHSAHLSPSHWASPSFLRKKDTNNPPVTGWVFSEADSETQFSVQGAS